MVPAEVFVASPFVSLTFTFRILLSKKIFSFYGKHAAMSTVTAKAFGADANKSSKFAGTYII